MSFNSGTNVTEIDGSLNLGTIIDVEQKIIDISNNSTGGGIPSITYDSLTNTTQIDGSLNLGTIIDVEQKIIDISNNSSGGGGTPYISYDSVYDRLFVDKDMDLKDNILYIGKMSIVEEIGSAPSGASGSLTLKHLDTGGTSSIVFRSERDTAVDHGYISYTDDYEGDTFQDRSLLELGCRNDSNSDPTRIDNIALMASGYVGINTRTPKTTLDVSGDICCNDLDVNGDINCDGSLNVGNPSIANSNLTINGKLNIFESIGSFPSSSGGSLTLVHGPTPSNRTSSIVFKSSLNTNDFGYIAYYDDYNNQPAGRSLLEIGVQSNSNDETTDNIDNIILSPSGYVGINTVTPRTMLDVRGNINCSEIQVNSIPINSFTNFRFGTVPGVRLKWGSGQHLPVSISQAVYSHNQQFDPNLSDDEFNCNFAYYGTYEITCNVIFKNLSTARLTPCIGIAINNDINDISGSSVSPKFTLRPHYQTPFSVQYVRMGEGKVCNLSCSRIFNFTSISQNVSINTYIERGADTTAPYYNEEIENTLYELFDASIQFKYLGNFDNITTS